MSSITRQQAIRLLLKYNKEPFHIKHALTVEGVMKYFAMTMGFSDNATFWGIAGLLHDIDFEQWPEEHCKKAPELLTEAGADPDLIHAVISHGYGICTEVKPEHEMERVLYAVDELTGLIGACALIRPSKSTKDMQVKSIRKKFKDKKFAAGCSRDVIQRGAEMLGWDLDELFEETLIAMQSCEEQVEEECNEYTA